MLVKVPLMGDPKFYMMLQTNAVWAAIPDANSVLLHLLQPLNWPVHPDKVMSGELGPTELIVGLHQYVIGGAQGAILPARLSLQDVCRIFGLVPFSAAAPDREVPIGVHPGFIFGYAPSYDKDGNDVGTNIYCSRPFAKVGNVKMHVVEKVHEVTMRLGVKPEDLLDPSIIGEGVTTMTAPQTTQ